MVYDASGLLLWVGIFYERKWLLFELGRCSIQTGFPVSGS